MTLYKQLQTAQSEEDVKDAYILALGLKGHTKGLIDIRTREIWFEAKDTGRYSSYAMFTQLLHYVQDALNKGDDIPPFLAVIDTEKAALMKSSDVLPFLKRKTVTWGKSASKYTPEALAEISAYIGTHFVSFKIATHEEEFIATVKAAIKTCVAAHRFQYDYLNDDIAADGKIDYSLTNKVPLPLRAAIAAGKNILVLINPPYAEATNRGNTEVKLLLRPYEVLIFRSG